MTADEENVSRAREPESDATEFEQIMERLDRLEAMLERAIMSIENIPVDDPYY